MSNITPITAAQTQSEADRLQASLDLINSKIADLAADVSAEALETEKVLLARAEHVRKALKDARRRERDDIDDIDADDANAVIEEAKATMLAFIEKHDVNFVADQNSYQMFNSRTQVWNTISPAALPNFFPPLKDRGAPMLFAEVMEDHGRNFLAETYSFKDVDPTVLNKLRWSFLEPQEGQHHWIFDLLMRSLCGGKDENIRHLERLILAKYHRPDQHHLPTAVFFDAEGGTGKGLLGMVMGRIFGTNLVSPNVMMSQLIGNFNAMTVGKAVVMINEAADDKTDFDALKSLIGSERRISNEKFQRSIEVDNTPLHMIFGNAGTTVVTITGTTQDRRWSVFRSTVSFNAWLAVELADRLSMSCTVLEADEWARDNLDAVIKNDDEVAKWLAHLIAKHGQVTTVSPLHGEDYRFVLAHTRPLHERVFAKVFGAEFSAIKKGTLHEFYLHAARAENHRMTLGRSRFYGEAETWLRKNRSDIAETTMKVGGSSVTAFKRDTHKGGLDLDEYVIHDHQTGRPTWLIELD